jgi:hypothetical protein
MKKLSARAAVVAVAAAAASIAAGGIAYAFWTTSGAGNAAATAGSASGVTTQTGPISVVGSSLLYPGGGTQAAINVHNPNAFPVTITSVTLTASSTPSTIAGAAGTCTTHAVSVTAGTYNVATNTIPAGQDGEVVTNGITGNVAATPINMGVGSDDGCRNATFVFSITGTNVASHNA